MCVGVLYSLTLFHLLDFFTVYFIFILYFFRVSFSKATFDFMAGITETDLPPACREEEENSHPILSGQEELSSSAAPEEQQPKESEDKKNSNWKASKKYYYWHAHEKERAKLGDVAPMPVPVLVTHLPSESPVQSLPQAVKKYSWADEAKNASIYVNIIEESPPEELDPSTLQVVWTKRSLSVSYTVITSTGSRKNRLLSLQLSNNIQPELCTHKVKESSKQIYLKAVKETESAWLELTGTAAAVESPKANTDDV